MESGTEHQIAQQTVLIVTHGEQVSLQYVHNQLQDKHSQLPQDHVQNAQHHVLNVTEQHVPYVSLDTPLLVEFAKLVQELVLLHAQQLLQIQHHVTQLQDISYPQDLVSPIMHFTLTHMLVPPLQVTLLLKQQQVQQVLV